MLYEAPRIRKTMFLFFFVNTLTKEMSAFGAGGGSFLTELISANNGQLRPAALVTF